MKTLTIREVPDEVYAVLKEQAQSSNRSLQAQILWIMAKEVRLHKGGFMNAAQQWRHKLSDRNLGDTIADIHAGRERI